jgi:hypothetical protein
LSSTSRAAAQNAGFAGGPAGARDVALVISPGAPSKIQETKAVMVPVEPLFPWPSYDCAGFLFASRILEPISKLLETTSHCSARERGHPETR